MSRVPRRSFLATLTVGALGVPRLSRAGSEPVRLPLSFSTLGCPGWSWKRILGEAQRLGYAAIELRGLMGEMNLPRCAELQPSRINATKADLSAAGLTLASLDASAHMHEAEPAARQAQLDEARRFIDLAASLGAPFVRVFGDHIPPGDDSRRVVTRVVSGLQTLAEHARGTGVVVLLETHGDFTSSDSLAAIMEGVGRPEVRLLWDTHHTFVSGGEQPSTTFARIGKWVCHTHIKDSRPDGNDRRYVLLGQGTVPVQEIVQVLASGGYAGFYSFEWEKVWHPEIEEPEVAVPQYASVMKEYLAAAGVRASG